MRFIAVVFALTTLQACDNECPRYTVLRSVMDAPVSSPPDDMPWIGGARGDIRYEVGAEAPEAFDPLVQGLLTQASTDTVARWTAFTRNERLFIIEQPLPTEAGGIIPVNGVVTDVDFTGGYGTFGWWQSAWDLTADSQSTNARANLIPAFSDEQIMVDAQGTLEVVDVGPLQMRVDIVFTDVDGIRIRMFSDVTFDRAEDIEICSR